MTNWTALIPARIRTTLYIGFGILSLTQTAVLAYTAAVGLTAPLWAIGGGAVLGVIGGAFGFVAAGNTNVALDAVSVVKLDPSLLTERIDEIIGRHEASTQDYTDDTTVHSGDDEDYAPTPGTTLDLGAEESLPHRK